MTRHVVPSGDRYTSAAVTASALIDALFAEAAIGLGVWDAELRYRRVNARLAAMDGVPVDAYPGRRPRDVFPDGGERLEAVLASVLATGQPARGVEIAGRSSGEVERHWRADYFPISEGDAVVGVAALAVEVTGEHDASERSASVDAELRALYAALPVGVAFLSPELRYLRVNETLALLNGRPAAAHVGASLEEMLGPHAPMLRETLRQVMTTREPIELQMTVALPHDPNDLRAKEAAHFPVVADSELLGVGIVVRDVTVRHRLEREQAELLREAERARDEAERGRARLAVLSRAGREMSESIDWETTLRAVVRSVVPGIADWASLTIREPGGRLRVHSLAHHDHEREQLARELFERYPIDPDAPSGPGHVLRTGAIQHLADVTPELLRSRARDDQHLRLLERLNPRDVIVAPLIRPTGPIGALTLVLGDSDRRFAPEDVEVIRSLAARAALHIENARLSTERAEIARTLQSSLLPRALPTIPGAVLAARYRPAGDQNTVGGDFYDVFPTGPDVWTAIVGDVSGKGAAAAALTALARYTLRASARIYDDPAANLAILNAAFYDDAAPEDFCSAVLARVRPVEDGLELYLANGGHLSPHVIRVDGRVEAIEAGRGPLVGAVPDARFSASRLLLAPGELLLFYTDGVTEVRTSDPTLGERELHATLGAHASGTVDEVVDAVVERAIGLQDGRPRDDIALLAIKATSRVLACSRCSDPHRVGRSIAK